MFYFPAAVKEFLSNVCKMEALDEPNYEKFVEILKSDLKKLKSSSDILEFGAVKSPVKKSRKKPEEPSSTVRQKIKKKPAVKGDDEEPKSPARRTRNTPLEESDAEEPLSPVKRTRRPPREDGDVLSQEDEPVKPKRRRRVLSETASNEIGMPFADFSNVVY